LQSSLVRDKRVASEMGSNKRALLRSGFKVKILFQCSSSMKEQGYEKKMETQYQEQAGMSKSRYQEQHWNQPMIIQWWSNTGRETTIPTPTTRGRGETILVHNKHIQHKCCAQFVMCCQPANQHLLHHFRYSKEPLFFSKQWLTSNYLLQSPVWKHEGHQKKNTSNTLQILSKQFLFFPHRARKKNLRPQSWR
jgi:hypothetical protein